MLQAAVYSVLTVILYRFSVSSCSFCCNRRTWEACSLSVSASLLSTSPELELSACNKITYTHAPQYFNVKLKNWQKLTYTQLHISRYNSLFCSNINTGEILKGLKMCIIWNMNAERRACLSLFQLQLSALQLMLQVSHCCLELLPGLRVAGLCPDHLLLHKTLSF